MESRAKPASEACEELLQVIWGELSNAALEWKVFRATFDEANRETIERSAEGFFAVIRIALERDLFMALDRLGQPGPLGQNWQPPTKCLFRNVDRDATSGIESARD